MDENKIRVPIRSALVPNYYQRFQCLAQECRDSCCINWRISFDKKDYLRLRRLDAPKDLRERLDRGVRREKKLAHDGVLYGKFDLDGNSGRCPFLDPDGLCAIQRACGHEALPHVCTSYPRKIGYSPAAKEYTLSPSCEGVLQQLWDLPDGVEFVEEPLPKEEWRSVHVDPEETLTLFFAPLRELFIDILQSRALTLTERMLYLGMMVQRLQKEDWANFNADNWVSQTVSAMDVETVREKIAHVAGNRDMYLMQNLKVLDAISTADKRWPADICTALEVDRKITVVPDETGEGTQKAEMTIQFSRPAYEAALEHFCAAFADEDYFFENLMVASALYLDFPNLNSRENLWKSYVSLCNLYSFYRFVSVLGCKEDASKERLFHMIVMASRATLHNRDRFNGFQEELFQHDSSTLAHMAILLFWD